MISAFRSRVGGDAEPGVQMDEPPGTASGVQISPRVAATPELSRGGRDPGTVSTQVVFQDPGVEDHLIRAIRVDDDLNQPEIDSRRNTAEVAS